MGNEMDNNNAADLKDAEEGGEEQEEKGHPPDETFKAAKTIDAPTTVTDGTTMCNRK
ncbi:hypothetical protein FH972_014395 [Carpinus fangiana]|uniref:Uncharacterized protein n=1 Tax=Carpinus fangiana TaxID=176857 RepID=A0A5N6R9V1_9ROSI|nr:hypothetical protein FH972_014395 [Carpinus fangiana]